MLLALRYSSSESALRQLLGAVFNRFPELKGNSAEWHEWLEDTGEPLALGVLAASDALARARSKEVEG